MRKLLRLLKVGIPILLLGVGFSEPPNNFRIENERGYKMKVSDNIYTIKISPSSQSIFKMKGYFPTNGR